MKTSISEMRKRILERCDELLVALNLTYTHKNHKYISLPCPVHGGDNPCGCTLYNNTDYGFWLCHTHGCHENYNKDIIGFVQAVLNKSEKETFQFLNNFLNTKYDVSLLKGNSKEIVRVSEIIDIKIPRKLVLDNLIIPSPYFLKRNYSSDILIKYDIGDCKNVKKQMAHRAVIPLYDDNFEFAIGTTGRSIFDKCAKCKLHHSDLYNCPEPRYAGRYSKWKHQKGFDANTYLFNLNHAKNFILNTGLAIICESPGNVLRLEEAGIHNAVCTFGTKFSLAQRQLLDRSGAFNLLVIEDNDINNAGDLLSKRVRDLCSMLYNIKSIKPKQSDVGEMTVEEIKNWSELYDNMLKW